MFSTQLASFNFLVFYLIQSVWCVLFIRRIKLLYTIERFLLRCGRMNKNDSIYFFNIFQFSFLCSVRTVFFFFKNKLQKSYHSSSNLQFRQLIIMICISFVLVCVQLLHTTCMAILITLDMMVCALYVRKEVLKICKRNEQSSHITRVEAHWHM